MNRTPVVARFVLAGISLFLPAAAPAQEPAAQPRGLSTKGLEKEFKGDFDGMLERRVIRVLAPYSRTFYFSNRGREGGIGADLVRDFERYINTKYAKQLGKRPVTVAILPTTRNRLMTGVAAGAGDIAIGNLTVTEERKKTVDFFAPEQMAMSEIVLTGPGSPAVQTADDLAGRTVHVRKSSSYYESLLALNDRLKKGGKPPVNLVFVPEALEDEDMMEMLNTGVLQAIVVDDIVARMWAPVLPKVRVNAGAAVRAGSIGGWAIRKDSPKLRAILGDFYTGFVKKQNLIAARLASYNKKIKQLKDPTRSGDYKRFEEMIGFFRKYGARYGFDPLMLAAQGYQESQLDQGARSQSGAVGLMQLLPATGAEMNVGDIHVAEHNVHAGTKYMDQLVPKYFPDAKFDEQNRTLFAFAAYNAGPGNIRRMRTEAAKRGLDPDLWFNNVEIVTAAKIGTETATYVRNIFKYYVAYKLTADLRDAREKARESVKPGN